MSKSMRIALIILTYLIQSLACAEWTDITPQVNFTKSAQGFDRINRVVYSLVAVHNISGHTIPGSVRLRIFNASSQLSHPTDTNANESHIEIPGGLLEDETKFFRVDFQLTKRQLEYSLALECNIVHVTTNGSDVTGDGTQAHPFATIQNAINQSIDGDTILVHKGRYIENINFMGKAITVGSRFMLDGNPDHISNTIIDANRVDSAVIFDHGEGLNSRLIGLSITNGYANGATYETSSGGGIRAFDSSPYLESLYVYNNEASHEGGGIFFDIRNWSPLKYLVVAKSIIKNNRTHDGGGVHLRSDFGGNAYINNSAIIGNHASHSGGGLYLYHIGTFENSIVSGNTADFDGGGACIDWGTFRGQQAIHFINTNIVSNSASSDGGGIIYIIQGGEYINSIVWNNSPNNIRRIPDWWDDGIAFNYSVSSPLISGFGNLDTDPLFIANPDSGGDAIWGTADDNYGDLRLQSGSPLIDRGDSSATTLPTDYQGDDRVYGNTIDIGAYEWYPQ